jgi:hypothetical protein
MIDMKRIGFLMFISTLFFICTTLETNAQTEIIIIGTAHRESANQKKADLYNILSKVKPDIILFELDSSLMGKDFKFSKQMLSYFEAAVVDSFLTKNPSILLRPFDIEGRNDFFIRTKYFDNEWRMFSKIHHLYKNDSLPAEYKVIHNASVELSNLLTPFSASRFETLNTPEVDAIVKIKMNWYHNNYSRMIRNTDSLKRFIDHFQTDSTFWIKRNNQMARHIIQFAELYKGKKIAVITGHYHRYFLLELLKPLQEKHLFRIKEFYED